MILNRWVSACALAGAIVSGSAAAAGAETFHVAAGGSLQLALNNASPGDTILLQENAEFVGNFVLPAKTGDAWITLRTAAPDSLLPPADVRVRPAHAPLLARLRSPNSLPALRTAAGAHHWAIRYLEFRANQNGLGDIIQLGDGSSAQNTLARVPHHLELRHLYVHGDPRLGQKRCIALNSGETRISDSHISDCKAVGQDSQAIGGWNGPGPYVIENNYLEGAAENFLLGGADPAIPNLVADGVTFRRNHVSRPLSWRDPIIGTPSGVQGAAEPGGSLAAGVYGYRVVARGPVGLGTIGRSTASAAITVSTTAAASAVRVRWQPVPGATEYRVYGRGPGGQNIYWRVTTTEFVDTGAAGTSENVPTSAGAMWTVKNLFELKSARNVLVADNIFENHWKQAQPGYAIVLTPRNQGGNCTWCVVERVRFEYNVVRNVAAGINLTGYDSPTSPTRQSTDIAFEHNLFAGVRTSLGGNAWFMLVGDEPRNVTLAHNTIDANGTTVIFAYGGSATSPGQIRGFEMTANAARHGSYGVNGQDSSFGNVALAGYFPDAVFSSNYLAGAPASRYPAGTLVAGAFGDQFTDAAAGDYSLRTGSTLKGGAADGSDIGVNFEALRQRTAGVLEGVTPIHPADVPDTIAPTAEFTASCVFLACALTDATVAGSGAITASTWTFGEIETLPGPIGSYTFGAAGTYRITLTVEDANRLSSTASKTVTVAAPIPATAGVNVTCTYLQCAYADSSMAGSGAITARTWTFGDGTVVQDSTSGVHLFAAPGTYVITLQIADVYGFTSRASTTVTVGPPKVHASYSGTTLKWSSASGATNYWSADVVVRIEDAEERPIAGATVTAVWSGAVVKTVSCVTGAAGLCTLKSGTLSYLRATVTLAVTSVVAPGRVYDATMNHAGVVKATAFTLNRP